MAKPPLPATACLDTPADQLDAALGEVVEFAIAIGGADFGNIQLIEPATGDLRIRAHRGLPDWWIDYWNSAGMGQGSCHATLTRGARLIVEDVESSPIFVGSPALEVQRKVGIRGVQSTPIVNRAGIPLGVFSTHYKSPCRPDQRTLMLLDLLASQAANLIERHLAEQARRQSEERLRLAQEAAQKELWEAKQQAEAANAAKSRFLAAASHDLRQPLSALSLYLRTLEGKLPTADKGIAQDMQRCLTGLNELLSDLLDLSKLEAGAVQPTVSDFSLDVLLEKVVSGLEPLARRKGLSLRLRGAGAYGRTDPILLQRILMNLVSNAIRYTEAGGILIALRKRSGKRWIEVWDTGIGIPADKTSEIFEEFKQLGNYERNRDKGTGIGLTIVAKQASLLGLEVRVRSRPGKGSLFAVEIPRGRRVHTLRRQPLQARPLVVALVEDNTDVAKALVYALEAQEHTVIAATTLDKAIDGLPDRVPDIVISDYRLAGSQTGYDVITALRACYGSHLPAMLITGDTDPDIIRYMAQQGIAVHHKPLDMERFFASLADLTSVESI